MSKKESFLGFDELGDNIHMDDMTTMASGKVIKKGKMNFDNIPDMPKAESFDEFCALLTKFLATNKAEFAIYIGHIGVLPKVKQNAFAMFSEDKDNDDDDNMAADLARLAVMFHQLCENKHRNVREELERFVGTVALADKKSGGDAFDDESED